MTITIKHLGLSAPELRQELRGFYGGDGQLFKTSGLGSLIYTSGVRYFFNQAGAAGAYWLRDLLATQPEVRKAVVEHGFVVVLLDVPGNGKATLTVSHDCETKEIGEKVVRVPTGIYYQRKLDHTDVQPGQWCFYIENETMMLPSER